MSNQQTFTAEHDKILCMAFGIKPIATSSVTYTAETRRNPTSTGLIYETLLSDPNPATEAMCVEGLLAMDIEFALYYNTPIQAGVCCKIWSNKADGDPVKCEIATQDIHKPVALAAWELCEKGR